MTGKTRYVGLPICGIKLKSYYKDGKELVDYKGKTYEVGCETCDNHDADSCNSCGLGTESYSLNTSSNPIYTSKEQNMKKIKITVRWFDGFKRDFFPVEYEFGNSYLWMKFEDKEEWLPLVQVRNIKTAEIKE